VKAEKPKKSRRKHKHFIMKKLNLNPLSLDKETIARLDDKQLLEIVGGNAKGTPSGSSSGCGSGGSTCSSGASTGCGNGGSCCFIDYDLGK